MTGREYIEDSYIKELGYLEAEQNVLAQIIDRLKINNNRYTMGWFIDEPIYPANAEFYDEFVDDSGDLYEEDLIDWGIRYINNNSKEYRIDTKWEDEIDTEVYYLRELTADEKEELGL